MPQDSNTPTGDAPSDHNTRQRRTRSASQPSVAAHVAPMSSPSSRAVDPLDFSFLNQYNAGPSSTPSYPQPGYNDDAFLRALRSLQDASLPAPVVPQVSPTPPPALNPALNPALHPMASQHIPNPTEAFLAAIPWMQYLQIQSIYGQQQQQQQPQQQQQQQHHPQHVPYMPPPSVPQIPFNFDGGQVGTFSSNEAGSSHPPPQHPPPPPPPQPSNPPSPEAEEPPEVDQVVSADDKRKRNTAASARFRIKKKQWSLNLERSISDMSGRVEELEREAGELRRENGWLKEIVMLKSKRLAGVVPDLEQSTSTSTPGNETHSPVGEGSSREGSTEQGRSDKGKGRRVG